MERVRAAVEDEERQAAAAADTSAAAAAIASAAEASKVSSTTLPKPDDEEQFIEELSKSMETGPDDSKDSTQINVRTIPQSLHRLQMTRVTRVRVAIEVAPMCSKLEVSVLLNFASSD